MDRRFLLAVLLITTIAPNLLAGDYLLPVFAVRVPARDGSTWSSEVYVTNPGSKEVVVHEGALLLGRVPPDGFPPCLPVVPTLVVKPHATVRWSPSALGIGIGCPRWAIGGLTFSSDGDVEITSRMVNIPAGADPEAAPLQGIGQEIPAVSLVELSGIPPTMLIPAVAWHVNACGPSIVDTNAFFTNPGDVAVTVTLRPEPDTYSELQIDGVKVPVPFVFKVAPHTMISFRLSGPESPLAVCLPPSVGAFSYTATGPVAVVASVVDRVSGDARTSLPVPVKE